MSDHVGEIVALQAKCEAEIDTLILGRASIEPDERKTDPCPQNPETMSDRSLLEEIVSRSRAQESRLNSLDARMGLLELRFGTDERQGLQAWKRLDEYAGRIERVAIELELVRNSQQSLGQRQAILQAQHDEMVSKAHDNVIPLKTASEAE